MLGLKQKSSVFIKCISIVSVVACEKLPVDFGMIANDSQGNPVSCGDVTSGFGIEVPYLVETGQSINLKYLGGDEAEWTIENASLKMVKSGGTVGLSISKAGVYEGSMKALSICNSVEEQSFRLEVIEKLGTPKLSVENGASYTEKASVSLEHAVDGAEAMLFSDSPNCTSGNWVSYSQQSVKSLISKNTKNTIYAKFSNRVRESSCVSAQITHDSTAPLMRLSNLPDSLSADKNINIGIETKDHGVGTRAVFCSLNSSSYENCKAGFLKNNLKEGQQRFMAYAVDRLGNQSEPMSVEFELDHTKPVVSLSKAPELINKGGQQEYQFESTDNYAIESIECSLNNQKIENCKSPVIVSAPVESTYNLEIVAKDKAGNLSDKISHSFQVDQTGPEIRLTKKPLDPSQNDSAVFEFQVKDSLSGVGSIYCSINAEAYSPCRSGVTYSNLKRGVQSFDMYAVDKLGNRSRDLRYTWEFDDGLVSEEILVTDIAKKVDVVVVIDNSSSMKKEQREMGKRFSNFTGALKGLDWQLGIITTNADEDGPASGGRLQNFNKDNASAPQYKIHFEEEDLEKKFQKTIRRDEKGNDTEEAIHSLNKFLDRDSSKIVRSGASLATIIVSDEDEKSRGRSLDQENRPDVLVERIKKMYNGKKQYSNHSIVWRPGDRNCERRGGKYEANVYAELTSLTDGILGDICSTNYTEQLKDIGERIQEQAFSALLKCAPRDIDGDGLGDIEITYSPRPDTQINHRLRGNKLFFSPYPPKDTRIQLVYRCDK